MRAALVALTQAQLNLTQEIENLSAKYDYQSQYAAAIRIGSAAVSCNEA
jgi:hypothetical protein